MTGSRYRRLTAVATLLIAGAPAGPAFAGGATGTDSSYMKASHQSNLAEIASGRDAQMNATTACVKKVGAVLVRDHTRLDEQGKALADKLGLELPGAPNAEQQQQLTAVKNKAGTAAYDTAWLEMAAAGHKKTLHLIDHELAAGSNAEVKAAARAARPVVAMHLDMVRGGTCREHASASRVPAGNAGYASESADAQGMAGIAIAGGGLLTATAGAVWIVRRRRTTSAR
jgi:putative membrane protein